MGEDCPKCGAKAVSGPDPCLGFLPDIAHACCGHGDDKKSYCVGWPGAQPSETCYIKRDNDKMTYHPGENGGHYEFDYEDWDGEYPPKNGVFYPPREGIVTRRGQEAIEYMNSLKQK